jgi:hypothetical protein
MKTFEKEDLWKRKELLLIGIRERKKSSEKGQRTGREDSLKSSGPLLGTT